MSLSWNGTTVSAPILIFHDEVARSTRESDLICESNTTVASWNYPNGTTVAPLADISDDYVQFQFRTFADLIRNKDAADISPLNNGVWTCQLGDMFVSAGIYQRGGKYI